MHLPAGHWEDCYTRRLLFIFFGFVFFGYHVEACIIREEVQRSNAQELFFIFYNNNGRNKQHTFLENRLSLLLLASPRFLVREIDSLQAFPDREGIQISTTRTVLAQTYTHKGRDPQQPTNKKVEIDPRAAPRRNSPRPLSLSPFSSRRDIQPRGALRVAARIDFLRWYPRALLPLPPQPSPPSLFCVQIDGRNGCGREGEKEDAWLLVAWCCLDYRTYLIPPGFVVLYRSTPLPHARSSRLLCIIASFSRGSSARCEEE